MFGSEHFRVYLLLTVSYRTERLRVGLDSSSNQANPKPSPPLNGIPVTESVLCSRQGGGYYAQFTFTASAYAQLPGVPTLSALPSPDGIGERFACAPWLPAAHVRMRKMRSHFHKARAERPDEDGRRSAIPRGRA
jgi:hypothetical protein